MRKLAEYILGCLRKLVSPFIKRSGPPRESGLSIPQDLFFEGMRTILDEGKDVVMTPKGNSMLPFIQNGKDSVILTKPSRPVEVGDIILFKTGDRYIMHRVISVEGGKLTMMGDGNVKGKETCGEGDVIGLVTEIHKENGKVVRPGKARLWRLLRPFRRYILAFYKRVIL